jgi:hypothetical protein
MSAFLIGIILLAGVLLGLALPPALHERSWKRFFIAFILSFVGIILPLFIFVMSAFLVPDWKGACRQGWLDCFHMGKLALLPLVLWASAAWYRVEIYRTPNRLQTWIVLGMAMGAIVSTVCLVIGLVVYRSNNPHWPFQYVWFLVPLYVSVWYLIRACQLFIASNMTVRTLVSSFLWTIPLWITTFILTRKCYASLPDQAPSCFIATAASRGHSVVVGTRRRVRHDGQDREANQQLMTLWNLEDLWARRAPNGHARFRKVYNVVGPMVAARVASPFVADVVYLALKPVEITARIILTNEPKDEEERRAT